MAIKLHPSIHVHAGEWVKEEIVTPRNITVTDLAHEIGVTRAALSNLLNGKAGLSAHMAISFEKVLGVSADTLMRMQASYELARVRETEAA